MQPDYFGIYKSLNIEQKMIMESTRDWVNRFVRPKIEESFNAEEPLKLNKNLADLGAFGPIFPEKYGNQMV